jgi:hypothetical protein
MGSDMFFNFPCPKMREAKGDLLPIRLIYSLIAEIVVSGGMSMPQILSTLDSRNSVDRSRSERS